MNVTYEIVIIWSRRRRRPDRLEVLSGKGARVLMLDAGEKRIEKADRDQFVNVFAELSQANRSPIRPYTRIDT